MTEARAGAWALAVVAAACAGAPQVARAHEVGLSYGVYSAQPDGVGVALTLAERELALVVGGIDADGDGKLTDVEVSSATAALSRELLSSVVVTSGEAACSMSLTDARRVESDGVIVEGRARCAPAPAFGVELALLDKTTPGHRHLVRIERPGAPPVDLVTHRADRRFTVGAAAGVTPPGEAASFGALFLTGIEHILGGLDHLLFLLGLVLVGGRVRTLVGTITAFTVAHSITLGLAVLGIWAPSGRIVEPLIALSVSYVAIENWFIEEGAARWPVTFAFGLVHGFGFAGALGEVRVPPPEVPRLLLAFNLGVEAGQLAVLAVVLPLLLVLRRQAWFRTVGVRAVSGVVAVFGLYWFVSRIWQG